MRVLIVEDEVDLADALKGALEEVGLVCDVTHDGDSGLFNATSWEYDAIILDLMLPGLDGRTILRRLREEKRTPVLVLTARDGLGDKVELLDSGADDYLTKPFELSELVARVRALIRRGVQEPRPRVEIGAIEIDLVARLVRRSGELVAISPKEFALLEFLALHRGELVTRTMIYDHIYDEQDDTTSNVLDVYVANLRRKLGRELIQTRRGEGYVIDA